MQLNFDSNGDVKLVQRWWAAFRNAHGVDSSLDMESLRLVYDTSAMLGHRHERWVEVVSGSAKDIDRSCCVGCAKSLGSGAGDRWRCEGENSKGNKCDYILCGPCRWLMNVDEIHHRVGQLRTWNAMHGRA